MANLNTAVQNTLNSNLQAELEQAVADLIAAEEVAVESIHVKAQIQSIRYQTEVVRDEVNQNYRAVKSNESDAIAMLSNIVNEAALIVENKPVINDKTRKNYKFRMGYLFDYGYNEKDLMTLLYSLATGYMFASKHHKDAIKRVIPIDEIYLKEFQEGWGRPTSYYDEMHSITEGTAPDFNKIWNSLIAIETQLKIQVDKTGLTAKNLEAMYVDTVNKAQKLYDAAEKDMEEKAKLANSSL